MIHLAYDGSTHGDWIARYAIRWASVREPGVLRLVHVGDGSMEPAELERKIAIIARECDAHGVRIEASVVEPRGDVAATIIASLDRDASPQTPVLVCGVRMRSTRRGVIGGTVSAELLAARPCHVAAIRVVQPGVLGRPHRVLLPVSGHPRGLRSAMPFVPLLGADAASVHLLRVMAVGRWRSRWLRRRRFDRLRLRGRQYAERVEQELAVDAGLDPAAIDTFVRVSGDWVKEVIVHAAHHRTQVIAVGATERSLPWRFVRRNPLERLLRDAPCDVVVYRGIERS